MDASSQFARSVSVRLVLPEQEPREVEIAHRVGMGRRGEKGRIAIVEHGATVPLGERPRGTGVVHHAIGVGPHEIVATGPAFQTGVAGQGDDRIISPDRRMD